MVDGNNTERTFRDIDSVSGVVFYPDKNWEKTVVQALVVTVVTSGFNGNEQGIRTDYGIAVFRQDSFCWKIMADRASSRQQKNYHREYYDQDIIRCLHHRFHRCRLRYLPVLQVLPRYPEHPYLPDPSV